MRAALARAAVVQVVRLPQTAPQARLVRQTMHAAAKVGAALARVLQQAAQVLRAARAVFMAAGAEEGAPP